MLKFTKAFSGFSVNDLAAAKNFYGIALGLQVSEKPEGLQLTIGPGTEVFIYPKPNHTPATFTILNFIVEDVEQTVDELTAAGVVFEHYDSEYMKTDAKGIARDPHAERAMAWFKDPAGNFLSIIQEKHD